MKPTSATTRRLMVVVNIHKAVREPNSTRRKYIAYYYSIPGDAMVFVSHAILFLFYFHGAVRFNARQPQQRSDGFVLYFYVLCCVFCFLLYLTHHHSAPPSFTPAGTAL